jgi:peptidoglycan hydrolase-like protein with peptidoglycan-binding domain
VTSQSTHTARTLLRPLGLIALLALIAMVLFVALRSRPAPAGASASTDSSAGSNSPDAERAEWEASLGALSATDPAEFADLMRQITWLTEVGLARLGFNPGPLDGTLDPQTQEAVRHFEQSRKLPLTGDPVSFATMKQVIADADAMDRQPILLPPLSFVDAAWDRGQVSARGTWRMAHEEAADPRQATSIVCDRRALVCQATTALVLDTEGGSQALSLTTVSYEIDAWNGTEISTKPDRDHIRLRLARSTKSVLTESVEGGAIARQGELTDGSANYIQRFREHERTQERLLALSAETREWRARAGR